MSFLLPLPKAPFPRRVREIPPKAGISRVIYNRNTYLATARAVAAPNEKKDRLPYTVGGVLFGVANCIQYKQAAGAYIVRL